jgi:hypothetical protein
MNESDKYMLNVIRNATDQLIEEGIIQNVPHAIEIMRTMSLVYKIAEDKVFNDLNEDMETQVKKDRSKMVYHSVKRFKS